MIVMYDLIERGACVYVGITSRPKHRMWEHIACGTVHPEGRMEIVCCFRSRIKALAAERARIKALNPPRNRARSKPSRREVARTRELARHNAYAAMWDGAAQAADDALGAQCSVWKREGLTVREIAGRVKSEYKITVSHGAVQNYVTKRK